MKRKQKVIFLICFIFSIIYILSLHAEDFNKRLYEKRRQNLMKKMETGIAVFKNSEHARRSNDVNYYPFRTNSDFYYLTGFEDPGAAFILLPEGDKKFILFVQQKNAISAQWFGDVPGIKGAMEIFGADTAFAIDQFDKMLGRYLARKKRVYLDINNNDLTEAVHNHMSRLRSYGPKKMIDVLQYIHEMRIIKDPMEIKLIQKAVRISCDAHLEVMKAIEPGMYEYEINSIFSYIFEKNGSNDKAYESIVASGPNASIFHYSKLNRKTKNGELVMMDMGAEFKNYTSDITRVLPLNGKFSKEQKEIYEIVIEMEKGIIEHMIPGNKWFDCLKQAEPIAKEGLYRLGLITDKETNWQHLLYYFAYCGHPIGLDVHDIGDYGSFRDGGRVLEPGMVFAVEPLLYIGDNLVESFKMNVKRRFKKTEEEVDIFLNKTKPVFEKYACIAARVEDNILITKEGNENLSLKLPRTVKEIEKTMTKKSYLK
jgi:Xaa-Pro aminopeptidase